MPARRFRQSGAAEASLGLIQIDYDNLFDVLAERTRKDDQPHRFLVAMVGELRRYLDEQLGIKPIHAVAYGDFGAHEIDAAVVMNDLAMSGIEVRHVPWSLQRSNALMSLTIHATELLHSRSDLDAYIILSGDHWYTPLVQHVQRFGKFALVASLDLPANMATMYPGISDALLSARFLLDARARESLKELPGSGDASPGERRPTSESVQSRAPEETSQIEDPGAQHAMEIIEEYFGQYEEVYLTPLLRKLTETLDDEDGEPKDLVNLIQEAGAVWLEKRRGFPYDYTVLLVNQSHPDVIRVKASFESYDGPARPAPDFDEEYEDDAFDEEAYEEEEVDDDPND